MDGERYMNVAHVASVLGVSPKPVCGWVAARTIPPTTFPCSAPRFEPPDIEAWAESRTVAIGPGGDVPGPAGAVADHGANASKGAA